MSSNLNKRAGVVKMLRELVSALCENVDTQPKCSENE